MRKNLLVVIAAGTLAGFIGAAVPAGAATSHNYPLPKGVHSCRLGYHKVNRKHWVNVKRTGEKGSKGKKVKRTYLDCVANPATSITPITVVTTTLPIGPTGTTTTTNPPTPPPPLPPSLPQPVVTVTEYDTVQPPGTCSFECNGTVPPDPLMLPMVATYGPGGDTDGAGVDLWVEATGGDAEIVTGTLTFTVTGPTQPWLENSIGSGSSDCSAIVNAGSDGAGCELYIDEDGTYDVSISFNSGDPNYASVTGPTVVLDITGS